MWLRKTSGRGKFGAPLFLRSVSVVLLSFFGGCALPQPTQIERQDFVPKRDVLLANIVRTAQEDYSRGRLFDAELGLRKAMVLAPDVTQIALNLGRTLARNGQPEEAQRVFARVLQRKSSDAEILNFIGESFFEGGELEMALDYFERAQSVIDDAAVKLIPLVPGVAERTLKNLSTTVFRQGDIHRARCALAAAYELSPSPENMIRLARIETAVGSWRNAETLITTFFTLNVGNTDPRLYLLRAIARTASLNNEQAIEDLNAALKREELIQEYALELRLMAAAIIPPVVDEEGNEREISESSESEEVEPESLSDAQRLYIPESVLLILDQYREKKLAELEL